jgi:tRNA U34 5-carboxymethylaminomethyl modifying GTPase MnmE/TrmE
MQPYVGLTRDLRQRLRDHNEGRSQHTAKFRPWIPIAINTRHRDCLRRALESCDRAQTALGEGLSAEYVAVDLDEALRSVGEVIGVVDVEQILDSVFSQFCISK